VGLAVLIIGSAVPGVSNYIAFILFPVMAVPILIYLIPLVVYLRSGRMDDMTSAARLATPQNEAPPADAPAQPATQNPSNEPASPTTQTTPTAAGSTEGLTDVKDGLARMESQLLEVVRLSNSILETVTKPVAAAQPQNVAMEPTIEQTTVGKRVVIKVKQPKGKEGEDEMNGPERPTGAAETPKGGPREVVRSLRSADVEGDETGGSEGEVEEEVGVAVRDDQSGGPGPKTRPGSISRMEELNILREELMKLRSKLEVVEPRQK
jgi:hypothetical protein